MSLDIPITIEEIKEEDLQPNTTYKMNFEIGRVEKRITGIEAIHQFIIKVLITTRFKYIIYTSQYGNEIKNLVYERSEVTNEYIAAELPRLIEDCLVYDARILRVYNFKFYFEGDNVFVDFDVDTILGLIHLNKVVIN